MQLWELISLRWIELLLRDLGDLRIQKRDDGSRVLGKPKDLRDDQEFSDFEVRACIAKDLGISSPDLVYVVEQPDYHLDMGMTIMGNPGEVKTVVLNDSIEVAKVYWDLLQSEGIAIDADVEQELIKISTESEKTAIYERAGKYLISAKSGDTIEEGSLIINEISTSALRMSRFRHNTDTPADQNFEDLSIEIFAR